MVTIFKSIKDTDAPFFRDATVIFDRIRNGTSKDLVLRIRNEKDKTDRNELKKQLPAICFSGTFNKRADSSLIEHSGLICLDFDGYAKQKEMLQEKERLSKNKFVYSVFVSPSGNGLKVLVKVPADADNHVNYFNSLEKHFNSQYFDKTSKNLSRVCYESYDPLIYVNPTASVWTQIDETEYQEKSRYRDRPTIPITDENKIVEILIKWWEKKYPMVEGQRNHNCYILARAFNDFGINKSLASYVLGSYADGGFNLTEIGRTIDSAYQDTASHGTRYYEDEERLNQARLKLRRGSSRSEVKSLLMEQALDHETAEAVIERIEEENAKQVYWSKNDKGSIKIVHVLFKQYSMHKQKMKDSNKMLLH